MNNRQIIFINEVFSVLCVLFHEYCAAMSTKVCSEIPEWCLAYSRSPVNTHEEMNSQAIGRSPEWNMMTLVLHQLWIFRVRVCGVPTSVGIALPQCKKAPVDEHWSLHR